jgi:hypothetical protein
MEDATVPTIKGATYRQAQGRSEPEGRRAKR